MIGRETLNAFRAGAYERQDLVKAATAELAMDRNGSVADCYRSMTDAQKAIWLTMSLGMDVEVANGWVERWIVGGSRE